MLTQSVIEHIDSLVRLAPIAAPPAPVEPPFGAKLNVLLGWLLWIAILGCTAGVIITGAKMAFAWRSGGDANVGQLGWVMVGCILVGTASGIANALVH